MQPSRLWTGSSAGARAVPTPAIALNGSHRRPVSLLYPHCSIEAATAPTGVDKIALVWLLSFKRAAGATAKRLPVNVNEGHIPGLASILQAQGRLPFRLLPLRRR